MNAKTFASQNQGRVSIPEGHEPDFYPTNMPHNPNKGWAWSVKEQDWFEYDIHTGDPTGRWHGRQEEQGASAPSANKPNLFNLFNIKWNLRTVLLLLAVVVVFLGASGIIKFEGATPAGASVIPTGTATPFQPVAPTAVIGPEMCGSSAVPFPVFVNGNVVGIEDTFVPSLGQTYFVQDATLLRDILTGGQAPTDTIDALRAFNVAQADNFVTDVGPILWQGSLGWGNTIRNNNQDAKLLEVGKAIYAVHLQFVEAVNNGFQTPNDLAAQHCITYPPLTSIQQVSAEERSKLEQQQALPNPNPYPRVPNPNPQPTATAQATPTQEQIVVEIVPAATLKVEEAVQIIINPPTQSAPTPVPASYVNASTKGFINVLANSYPGQTGEIDYYGGGCNTNQQVKNWQYVPFYVPGVTNYVWNVNLADYAGYFNGTCGAIRIVPWEDSGIHIVADNGTVYTLMGFQSVSSVPTPAATATPAPSPTPAPTKVMRWLYVDITQLLNSSWAGREFTIATAQSCNSDGSVKDWSQVYLALDTEGYITNLSQYKQYFVAGQCSSIKLTRINPNTTNSLIVQTDPETTWLTGFKLR